MLVLTSAALLGLGLVAPAMTVETTFGRYDGWIRLLAPDLQAGQVSQYSLVTGILSLYEEGSLPLAVLLGCFTCLFPTFKLVLMASATEVISRGRNPGRLLGLVHHAGKFSMLDVLVIALLVLAIKGLPGSSRMSVNWGVYAFAASVVIGLIASILLMRLAKRVTTSPDPAPLIHSSPADSNPSRP